MKLITLKRRQARETIDKGWDPIPEEYAAHYTDGEYQQVDIIRETLDSLESWIGSFQGKRVLDLGGGPGQYTLAFAERGAAVTWHDPSRRYLAIAQQKARERGLQFEASLGYLEESRRLTDRPFDLVFNRICWYYCLNDRQFADLVYDLVAPGGFAYLDVCNAAWHIAHGLYSSPVKFLSKQRRLISHWIYLHLAWKIDEYYMPPRGRLAALLMAKPMAQLLIDYSRAGNDVAIFRKPEKISWVEQPHSVR